MMQRALAGVAAVALAGGLPAEAHADNAGPDGVLDAWAPAFDESSAERLVTLHDPRATLWGTNAGSLITAPEGVRFYFGGACAMRPPATVSLGERTTRTFGDAATRARRGTFVRDRKALAARFSFTFVRDGGRRGSVEPRLPPGRRRRYRPAARASTLAFDRSHAPQTSPPEVRTGRLPALQTQQGRRLAAPGARACRLRQAAPRDAIQPRPAGAGGRVTAHRRGAASKTLPACPRPSPTPELLGWLR
jgi:hypothetical protein